MSVTINGTSGVTFNDASSQNTAATGFGFKNRIINGAMVIDQRNAGASITANTNTYGVDRWKCDMVASNKGTVQQTPSATETGYATRVAAGFTNYLAFTSSAATSVGSTDYYSLIQAIEGLNVADLSWGTANAKTVTLSFLVYSSLTGTFGGAIQNSAYSRSYPFSYSIPAANTWTQITVTIAGDQTGTWLTTNGVGLRVRFNLGSGSTLSGTAGAWTAGDIESVTGATSVVGTNGATFYITGVQLEKGSTATSFDYRPYGTELALCQRYLPAIRCSGSGNNEAIGFGLAYSTTAFYILLNFIVTPRVIPTGATISSQTNFIVLSGNLTNIQTATLVYSSSSNNAAIVTGTVASGLTLGQACPLLFRGASATSADYIYFNGCEL